MARRRQANAEPLEKQEKWAEILVVVAEGHNVKDIANRFNVPVGILANAMKRMGISKIPNRQVVDDSAQSTFEVNDGDDESEEGSDDDPDPPGPVVPFVATQDIQSPDGDALRSLGRSVRRSQPTRRVHVPATQQVGDSHANEERP